MSNDGHENSLRLATRISASISLAGSLGVIYLYFRLKRWGTSHHVILFWMSIADIICSVQYIIGDEITGKTFCDFQGWVLCCFGLASQAWCTVVGFNLLLQVRCLWVEFQCLSLMKWWHLFVWGFSASLATTAAISVGFDETIVWCWIPRHELEIRIFTFFIPIWILFCLNVWSIAMIRRLLKKVIQSLTDDSDDIELGKNYRRVTGHVLLFMCGGMLAYLPSSIACVWEDTNYGRAPFIFKLLVALFCPLQGSCNFLAYTFVGLIRHKSKKEPTYRKVSISVKKNQLESSSQSQGELSTVLLPTPTNSVRAMGILGHSSQSDVVHTTDSMFSWSYYNLLS